MDNIGGFSTVACVTSVVFQPIEAMIEVSALVHCISDGEIDLTATSSGINQPHHYIWYLPDGSTDMGHFSSISTSLTGDHIVHITDSEGCEDYDV